MKKRLDVIIFEKGLTESREKAQRLILAGKVKTNGQLASKPGMPVKEDIKIEIKPEERFVGKGAKKIKSAFKKFRLKFKGKIVADIGASTGGFTDFVLKKGAKRVYAIDVGYGQLAYSLRKNTKVINMERTDVRDVEKFPEKIDIFLIDVSFISLKKILPKIKEIINLQKHKAEIIALVKPQFEVSKDIASKFKGVIKDSKIQEQVVAEIKNFAQKEGFAVISQVKAGLPGEKGNQEYFLYLRFPRKVLVFGTFDLLHPGHKFFLKEASKLGSLTVVIPSDERVLKLKKRKPVYSIKERIASLKKLGVLAELEKENPWQNVLEEKADIIVLGYDQNWEEEIKKAIKKTGYLVRIKKINKSLDPKTHKTEILRQQFDK